MTAITVLAATLDDLHSVEVVLAASYSRFFADAYDEATLTPALPIMVGRIPISWHPTASMSPLRLMAR